MKVTLPRRGSIVTRGKRVIFDGTDEHGQAKLVILDDKDTGYVHVDNTPFPAKPPVHLPMKPQ